MASIRTEMTGARPRVVESDGRWGRYNLMIHTDAGMLYLELLPMQGRELADILNAAFGSSAELLAELANETK